MRIKLICVGRVREKFIAEGCRVFLERLEPLQRIEVVEVEDMGPDKEGKLLLSKCKDNPIFAFSEEGQAADSLAFADFIKGLSGDVVFIIGGPDGLSDEVKKKAKATLSLSNMTFTHEMARLILLEQIYRAALMIKGKPYHR